MVVEEEWPTPEELKSVLSSERCVVVASSGFVERDRAAAYGQVLKGFVRQHGRCVLVMPNVDVEGVLWDKETEVVAPRNFISELWPGLALLPEQRTSSTKWWCFVLVK
jgi:hypothetical protein